MPFGLKKGEKDADLDSKKASLFGSRSKAPKSAAFAAASANPYAAAPPAPGSNPYASSNAAPNPYAASSANSDPYASNGSNSNPYAASGGPARDPYMRSQSSLTQPPTSSIGSLSLNGDPNDGAPPRYNSPSVAPNRSEKSPVPPGGYGGSQPRYANSGSSYGQTGGYGSDPYGSGGPSAQQLRPGGYGGLGRSNSQETMSTDAGRNALFGDAPQRAVQAPPQSEPEAQESGTATSYSTSTAGGYGATSGGYGSGSTRELTSEEQEEEDVQAAKSEIRFIKQQDVASTRNARRIAEQAEATGRETLARLAAQGERIHNTERNLDLSSHQNRLAEEKAKELKSLNRSMFAVHVANPFTAKKREEAAEAIALEKHQKEREVRDATQAAAYSSQARQHRTARDMRGNVVRQQTSKTLADRAKYQFEADSEDEAMENEIDENLDAIHRGARTLNALGKAMGEEIDTQNRHIDRIIDKTDKVDDQIAVNRARLERIR